MSTRNAPLADVRVAGVTMTMTICGVGPDADEEIVKTTDSMKITTAGWAA